MITDSVKYILSLQDQFSAKLGEARKHADAMDQRMGSLQSSIGKLGPIIAATFGVYQVVNFGKAIIATGSNIEQLNVAFKTMLGSQAAATKMISDITQFAKVTPFELTDVATSSKQLLAFGIEQDKIISSLRALGDVASGVSAPIGDIAYLYGTIKTQQKAMTVDIRQFANRGIPIYEELSKITGLNGAALQKFVEEGKVGFPLIEKAFQNMSGQGGKFFNLMQEQSKTTGGKISNLSDVIGQLQNDIFISLKPAIDATVGSIMNMVGSFRDAIKWTKENIDGITAVAVGLAVGSAAYISYTIAMNAATIATKIATVAQWALNVALTANPIGAIIVGVAALAAGIYYAYQKSETFRAALAGIGAVAVKIGNIFYGLGQTIAGALTFDTKMMLRGFETVAAGAKDILAGGIKKAYYEAYNSSIVDSMNKTSNNANAFGSGASTAKFLPFLNQYTPPGSGNKSAPYAAPKFPDLAADQSGKIDTGKVSGSRNTTINVTINKLNGVEKWISSGNMERDARKMGDELLKVLTTVINDAQIITE